MATYHAEFLLLTVPATTFLFLLITKHQTENTTNVALHIAGGTEALQNISKKLQTKAQYINTQGSEHRVHQEYLSPKSLLSIFVVTRCPWTHNPLRAVFKHTNLTRSWPSPYKPARFGGREFVLASFSLFGWCLQSTLFCSRRRMLL